TMRAGRRMDFDTEILVRLFWAGVPVVNLPTQVSYPSDGVSHFDLWRDNLRISWMHARLFVAMLPRLPWLLTRRLRGLPP
ncbi:MAG: glycosyltransferase family 2 protein, partial [Nevskiaceae bacterium]